MAGKKDTATGVDSTETRVGKRQLAQRIDALAGVSKQIELRAAGLREDIDRLDGAQETLSDTASRLATRVVELDRKNAGLEKALKDLTRSGQDAERRLQELGAQRGPQGSEVDEIREQLAALRRKAEDGGQELAKFRNRLSHIESALQEAKGRTSELAGRLEELASAGDALIELDADLAATRLEVGQVSERLAGLEVAREEDTALLSIETRLEALESSIRDTERRSGGSFGQLEERLTSVSEELEALLHRYSDLADESGRLAGALEAMETATSALTRELPDLEPLVARIAALEEETGPLVQTQREQQQVLRQVQTEVGRIDHLAASTDEQRGRMDLLAGQLQDLGQSSEAMLNSHRSSLAQLGEQVSSVAEQLTGLGRGHTGLDRRIAEILHNLGVLQDRADAFAEQLEGLAAAGRQVSATDERTTGLTRTQESQQTELQELRARLETLGEAIHETTELISQEAGKLSNLSLQMKGDRDQLQQLASTQAQQSGAFDSLRERLEQLETGQGADARDQRRDLEELRGQLASLEQELQRLDADGEAQDGKLDRTEEGLHGLNDRADAFEDRLAALDQVPERLRELQEQTAPINARLEQQDQELARLQALVEHLEQTAGELTDRIATETDRIVAQEESVEAQNTRLQELGAEVDQYRLDLSAVASRLDDLRETDDGLDRGLRNAMDRVEVLSRQDQHLEHALEAAQEKVRELGEAIDYSGSAIDAVRRDRRILDEHIGNLRSGVRVMGWTGVVAALVLVAMSLSAYLFTSSRQDADRNAVVESLEIIDRRLAGAAGPDPEGLGRLREEVDRLNRQVDVLDSRVAVVPTPDAHESDDQDQYRANVLQALDDPSGRLAQVKTEVPAVAAEAPPAPEDSSPPPEEVEQVSAKPEPPPDPWAQARRERRYTVQVLGVRDQASLQAFARQHRLRADSASWETRYQDRPWFVLFHGIYPSKQAARKAARELGRSLPGVNPWVRRIPQGEAVKPLD